MKLTRLLFPSHCENQEINQINMKLTRLLFPSHCENQENHNKSFIQYDR